MASKFPRQKFYDELLSFLADHIFQIPIRSFMEENSILFDPEIAITNEHRTIHARYKRLVDTLLECFCKDSQVTMEEAIAGIDKLQAISDLKQAFEEIFTQLTAASDFEVFRQMMMKCNITIQEQVLMMILAAVGSLPDSMTPNAVIIRGVRPSQPMTSAAQSNQDQDILQRILKESSVQAEIQRELEDENLQKVVAVSKNEAENLRKIRDRIDEQMASLTMNDEDETRTRSSHVKASSERSTKSRNEVDEWPDIGQSGRKAAPAAPQTSRVATKLPDEDGGDKWWPKDVPRDRSKPKANFDREPSSSVQDRFKAEMSKMSPEELIERQNFLRMQRDKLVALKKEQREKQLSIVAEANPTRPQSARAARTAMRQVSDGGSIGDDKKKEDEKKLAMRRAIADKLKQEVIGKH